VSLVAPHNLDAERAVLGASMIGSNAFVRVVDLLSAEDFYRTVHQSVWIGMRALHDRSEPIDLLTVTAELERAGTLADVTRPYLSSLTDGVPRSTRIEQYAALVVDVADRRRLYDACTTGLEDLQVAPTAEDAASSIVSAVTHSVRSRGDVGSTLGQSLSALVADLDSPVTAAPTGIPYLDRIGAGFRPGELTILAGRPGHGKTALALHMAKCAAAEVPVWFASLEMTRIALAMRWLASDARINLLNLRTGQSFEPEAYRRLSESVERLGKLPISIDDHGGIGIHDLRRSMMGRGGLLVVDYIQLLTPPREVQQYKNRTQEVSYLSRTLKALAGQAQCAVLALSQLNRSADANPSALPRLNQLRESGSLEQDADIVLLLSRDEHDETAATLHCAKHRNGATGVVPLYFDGATQTVRERANDDPSVQSLSKEEQVAQSFGR
jgi:replicative DNA helicase